ncbi:MAG TPA: tetratricopeptide repeat protein [Casimicrobiaceae bacterium]
MASADSLLKDARRELMAGRRLAATAFVEQALGKKLEATHAGVLFDLGNLFAEADAATARALFARALRLVPGHAGLLVNLGVQQERLGDSAAAERSFGDALARPGAEIAALSNLAHLLFAQQRFGEALPLFERLISVAPDAPAEVWNNLGVCQKSLRHPGAEASFKRALALAPESPQILANLGFLLAGQRRYDEARSPLERARSLDPGRLQVAAQCLELKLQFADWDDFEQRRRHVVDSLASAGPGTQTLAPFALLAISDDPGLQLKAARSFAWPALAPVPSHADRDAGRLRLGFAASTFHDHPVPRLVAEVLEQLDRDRFQVFAYELDASAHDAMRARIERAVDSYAELGTLASEQAVARLCADRIDLLFDLSGHTTGARPELFAARPAPIQVNYVGYAGTMGAAYFDYIISDAFATPESGQRDFAETLVLLEGCYLPSDSQREIAARPSRDEYALPEHAFVYTSQAAPYKILPEMFDLWMRVLAQVEQSLLWLRPMPDEAKANLRAQAERRGIGAERLVFAPQESPARYLARFRLANVYLDTYPFGSHTTVNDALYAGLPVVTLAGRSMAARSSASQVIAAGMPELVADAHSAYVDIAVGLARDRARLRDSASKLAEPARCRLFDSRAYVRRFEAALEWMWSDACARGASRPHGAR